VEGLRKEVVRTVGELYRSTDYFEVETPPISKDARKMVPTCIDCQPSVVSNAAIQELPDPWRLRTMRICY
jgi:hypothetical protein